MAPESSSSGRAAGGIVASERLGMLRRDKCTSLQRAHVSGEHMPASQYQGEAWIEQQADK